MLLIKVEQKILSAYIAMSNWIWKIYHIDIILRPKLCQFVQFEISPSMSHKVFIFFKITHMCYWLSCDLIPAYWCGLIPAYWSIIDSYGTSFQVLMCYWFSCDLFPACWCVIDSHVTSFQHTDVLLILMWPHSSILICYWFSCRVASRNLHLWALCLIT